MLDEQTCAKLARQLDEARRARREIEPLRKTFGDFDLEDAYRIQRAGIGLRVARGVVVANASSSHFVLSDDARAPRGLDLARLRMRVLVDGAVKHEAESSAISGNPLLSLVQLVELLHAHGQELPAGSLVLTGAATPA